MPLIILFQKESFLEALDGAAEVTQLDIDFCLFHVHFWYGLIVEQDLVEFNECLIKIIPLKSLLSTLQLLQNLLLLNLVKVQSVLHWDSLHFLLVLGLSNHQVLLLS